MRLNGWGHGKRTNKNRVPGCQTCQRLKRTLSVAPCVGRYVSSLHRIILTLALILLTSKNLLKISTLAACRRYLLHVSGGRSSYLGSRTGYHEAIEILMALALEISHCANFSSLVWNNFEPTESEIVVAIKAHRLGTAGPLTTW